MFLKSLGKDFQVAGVRFFSGDKMVRWLMLHGSHGLLSHTIPAKTEGDDHLRICLEQAQVA